MRESWRPVPIGCTGTCSLLRAVGSHGEVRSGEVREDHAEHAQRNVETFFGGAPRQLAARRRRSCANHDPADQYDRIILDMLAP